MLSSLMQKPKYAHPHILKKLFSANLLKISQRGILICKRKRDIT